MKLMKKWFPLMVALMFMISLMPTKLFAQELSKEERTYLLDYLNKTKDDYIKSIKGLSDAQWHYKEDTSRWSVAECAEHIIKSEKMLRGYVLDSVLTSPVDPAKKAEVKVKTEDIAKMIEDRSKKFKTGGPLIPKDIYATPAEALKSFEEERNKTIEYVKSTKDDLHGHVGKAPLGTLDAYQWLVFLTAHSARHIKQINEVETSTGYPK